MSANATTHNSPASQTSLLALFNKFDKLVTDSETSSMQDSHHGKVPKESDWYDPNYTPLVRPSYASIAADIPKWQGITSSNGPHHQRANPFAKEWHSFSRAHPKSAPRYHPNPSGPRTSKWGYHTCNTPANFDQHYRKYAGRGQYRQREQDEHILSYNPTRTSTNYSRYSLGPDNNIIGRFTVSRDFRRRLHPYRPINTYATTRYPSELVVRQHSPRNYEFYLPDLDINTINFIAGVAASLPPRFCLLTLQQAQWVQRHIDRTYWPNEQHYTSSSFNEVQQETIACALEFIELALAHGEDPLNKPVAFYQK